jgi:hypothetical protein
VSNNDSGENYATVGFESWDELTGIQYTHDNQNGPGAVNLVDSRAILVTTNTGRGGIRGTVDLQNGGFNQGAKVSVSTGQYRMTPVSGEYWLRNVPPETVSVTAQAQGYFPQTLDSVAVVRDVTLANVNFTLQSCPVPTDLVASDTLVETIELTWNVVLHQDLDGYNVYRSRWENGEFTKLNSEPVSETEYVDASFPDRGAYWYYVTAAYSGDGWSAESFGSNKDAGFIGSPVGIGDDSDIIPKEFFLSQNYPNPFNPLTSIEYGLPASARVRIDIFNILGQNVRTLVDEYQLAGYKRVIWDGKDRNGRAVSSGVYFYSIKAADKQATKKMVLLK